MVPPEPAVNSDRPESCPAPPLNIRGPDPPPEVAVIGRGRRLSRREPKGGPRQPVQGDRRPQHGQAVVPPARLRMSGGHPHLTISPADRTAAGRLLPPGRRRSIGHNASTLLPPLS
jgi:hypothetical protein